MRKKSPPRVMTLSKASFVPRFEFGDQAQVAQLCGANDGSKLGVGLVRLTGADIPWTIKYDEFVLVLEGTFTVTTDSEELVASSNEAIWLPAGTKLRYQSDNALLLYAIHPTDWATADDNT
jgi:ethanolamine utilization protein EutQ